MRHTYEVLLGIDVGNTHTVLGLVDGSEVVEHWRLITDPRRPADELAVNVRTLLSQHQGAPIDLTGIAVCSTVPPVLREMREMCRRYFPEVPLLVVKSEMEFGIPVRTDNVAETGSDRIMNALAVKHRYGSPAIVVDFGTATTFDAVSVAGEFLGGAIAPGIQISVDALAARGALLRRVEISAPSSVVATNTNDALRSGTVYGFAAQFEGMTRWMRQELCDHSLRLGQELAADSITVVATGGLAPVILGVATGITVYEPWLTLYGLQLAFDVMRKKGEC